MDSSPIVFYDGECKFCHASVDFILRHEKSAILRFSHVQSSQLDVAVGDSGEDIQDSIYVMENNVLYNRSDAALIICKYLRQPYSWIRVCRFLPKKLRDGVYKLIARNRQKFFGTHSSCIHPRSLEGRIL